MQDRWPSRCAARRCRRGASPAIPARMRAGLSQPATLQAGFQFDEMMPKALVRSRATGFIAVQHRQRQGTVGNPQRFTRPTRIWVIATSRGHFWTKRRPAHESQSSSTAKSGDWMRWPCLVVTSLPRGPRGFESASGSSEGEYAAGLRARSSALKGSSRYFMRPAEASRRPAVNRPTLFGDNAISIADRMRARSACRDDRNACSTRDHR